ncbi:MAG TPA: maleylpyruvate isomerase N-terminal domain-containing protein [Actinomycetota bacterium]|nr:maleylpyruvate isomerase N-terminal domain-containing protein [Actinomycetota bacterium]
MTLERSWLLATARAEREAMGRTIQYTEPQRWDLPSPCEGWRNRDVIAHLAASDVAAAAAVAGEAQTEIEGFIASLGPDGVATVEAFNTFSVEQRAAQPARAVIREWGRAADLFLARCAEIAPQDWPATRVYWVGGDLRIVHLLQSRVMEWWLHGEDVRTGAELPPRREHAPMYCVNDLAVRTLPYALSLAGLSFPGKSVRVILEAAGGGGWHQGLTPREPPPPGKHPDAVIESRGYEFALLAGRRLSADRGLAEGWVRVSGDEALAGTVLTHIRSFA